MESRHKKRTDTNIIRFFFGSKIAIVNSLSSSKTVVVEYLKPRTLPQEMGQLLLFIVLLGSIECRLRLQFIVLLFHFFLYFLLYCFDRYVIVLVFLYLDRS